MTLILRSDARALNHLGGSHGFSGPLDYVAMLDFSSNDYFRMEGGQRIDMTLADAVSVARATPGVARRRDMSLFTVPEDTPRISYNSAYGMSGLLIEKSLENFVSSPSNGAAVNIPNASGFVILSFKGGDASLSAANITLVETYMAEGRTCKRYSRSGGSITATLSVSGGASDIQAVISGATSGMFQGNFLGYGGVQAMETATLAPSLVSLITGGSFSIVMQTIANSTGSTNANATRPIAVKSGSPQGGLYHVTSRSKASNGTDSVATAPDGSGINASTNRASVNGTWNDLAVYGLTCSGRGDSAGVISYGQYAKATGLGAQFGTPANVYIGGELGSATNSAQNRLGGIITRVAIYDRMLTDDEAWRVANAWR